MPRSSLVMKGVHIHQVLGVLPLPFSVTLYNVFSRSGDVQYIRSVQHIGGYHEYIGGYHEYIGGYHEYIRGCSVHHGDITNTSVGYQEYIGDIMMHMGEQVGKNLSIYIENPNGLNIPQCTEHPQCTHDIPQCTEHLPMYSWYPPHAS